MDSVMRFLFLILDFRTVHSQGCIYQQVPAFILHQTAHLLTVLHQYSTNRP